MSIYKSKTTEVALFSDSCQSISVHWWQCQITDILRYQAFPWQLSSGSFPCLKDMREDSGQ